MLSYQTYFSLFILSLGGSPQTIGLVASTASAATLFVAPVAGYLADHKGRVKIIAYAFYIKSISYFIFFLSRDWIWLAVGSFIQGLSDFYQSAQSAIIADSLPPGNRALGYAILNAFPQIVANLGPIVGAYFITHYDMNLGMRYLFVISLVMQLIIGFGRHKFLKETLKSVAQESRSILSLIKESYKSSWEVIKWTPKSLAIFAVVEVISAFCGAMVGPFWVVYGKNVINLTISDWSLILLIEGYVGIPLLIIAGVIVDKLGSRRIMILMLFLSLFPVFFFIYCETFVQTLAVFLCLTVIISFLTPASSAFVADTVPRSLRARVSSAYGRGEISIRNRPFAAAYVLTIPVMLGSVAGGLIYTLNPTFPWLIEVILLSVCLVLSIFFVKEPETPEI